MRRGGSGQGQLGTVALSIAVAAGDLEAHLYRAAQNPGDRLGHERPHARAEPLLDEFVGCSNNEVAVGELQAHGVLQPGVVVGTGDADLKLAEGSIPDSLGSGIAHFRPPVKDCWDG
jgi:hypothetical protein